MKLRILATSLVLILSADRSYAQPVFAFSNNTTNTGFVLQASGAQMQGANTITALIADDIHADPASIGSTITNIEFGIRNFSGVNWTVRPRVRFYLSDGASGGPGTLIAGQVYDLSPVLVATGTESVVTFSPSGFQVPSAATDGINFWAGITFDDNNGTTGATIANLNSLGRPMYNPPTVGSSADRAFITAGVGDFAFSNPPGSQFSSSGSVPYNFRWAFQVQQVPEPSALALVAAGVVGGIYRHRRRTAWTLKLSGPDS
jgi:hypothetical protein